MGTTFGRCLHNNLFAFILESPIGLDVAWSSTAVRHYLLTVGLCRWRHRLSITGYCKKKLKACKAKQSRMAQTNDVMIKIAILQLTDSSGGCALPYIISLKTFVEDIFFILLLRMRVKSVRGWDSTVANKVPWEFTIELLLSVDRTKDGYLVAPDVFFGVIVTTKLLLIILWQHNKI